MKKNELITVYFDMDGVLADFEGQYRKHFNTSLENITQELLWENVKKVEDFWLNLDRIEGSQELWDFAYSHERTWVEILSAPTKYDQRSEIQKHLWLDKHFGEYKANRNFVKAKEKQKFADRSSILIDDFERNIEQFKANGGHTVHFKNSNQALEELKNLVQKLEKNL